LVTDGSGCVLFVNGVAQRLLADRDGLRLTDSGLSATTTSVTRRLRAALASVAMGACARQRFSITRTARCTPIVVTLMPLWHIDFAVRGAGKPRVAVFIQELDGPIVIDRLSAAESFGLTPREADIAALLATGLEIREIASQLALSQTTVRSHLLHIFKKTDTHSQTKLVLLVKGFGERRASLRQQNERSRSTPGSSLPRVAGTDPLTHL
jgi:DNA-binding CsgD family transcriptional regulator